MFSGHHGRWKQKGYGGGVHGGSGCPGQSNSDETSFERKYCTVIPAAPFPLISADGTATPSPLSRASTDSRVEVACEVQLPTESDLKLNIEGE